MSEALADTRVVLVNGARQAGKSTLARLTAARVANTTVRLLDDPATITAATEQPVDFIRHDGLMVIDEIQLAPRLIRPIKMVVDPDPTPGRFLLTGSSRLLALRTLPDALPGRMEITELWPFSQGEIADEPDRFIDATFTHGAELDHSPRCHAATTWSGSPSVDSPKPFDELPDVAVRSSAPTWPLSSSGTYSNPPPSNTGASC